MFLTSLTELHVITGLTLMHILIIRNQTKYLVFAQSLLFNVVQSMKFLHCLYWLSLNGFEFTVTLSVLSYEKILTNYAITITISMQ